jgi:hypothetical protein
MNLLRSLKVFGNFLSLSFGRNRTLTDLT